jgi:hypothetical protein
MIDLNHVVRCNMRIWMQYQVVDDHLGTSGNNVLQVVAKIANIIPPRHQAEDCAGRNSQKYFL